MSEERGFSNMQPATLPEELPSRALAGTWYALHPVPDFGSFFQVLSARCRRPLLGYFGPKYMPRP